MRFLVILFIIFSSYISRAQSYSFVFLNSRTDKAELPKEEVDQIMEGHMKNIARLSEEGKLLVAGPFEGGGGIFILSTPSVEEAQEWLSTDPGIRANRWRVEILPYTPRRGSVCPVGENFEMTTYTFVRYTPSPAPPKGAGEILKRHDDFLKKLPADDVITEAVFGKGEGGILILNKPATKLNETDPGVKQGLFTMEQKKIWVAKGSFCE